MLHKSRSRFYIVLVNVKMRIFSEFICSYVDISTVDVATSTLISSRMKSTGALYLEVDLLRFLFMSAFDSFTRQ